MLFRRSKPMTPAQASAAMSAGELVPLDVREAAELAEALLHGAIHIPLGQLPARVTELDPQRPVAFLCRSGGRSAQATRTAARAGLDAINATGGITAWKQAGLSVSTGKPKGAT